MGCRRPFLKRVLLTMLTAALVGGLAATGWADEQATTQAGPDVQLMVDTVWVLVAAFLVFWMNAGFGCVEAGFCRAKNAVNILGKNFVVFGISSLVFWAVGFGIMFGNGNALLGLSGWFVPADGSPATSTLSELVAADLNAEFGIDLSDEQHAALAERVAEVTAPFERSGGDATIKLELPDGKVFEKTYPADSYYWGAFASLAWARLPLLAKFFFQLVFAATAATIVSGCVAERIHYHSYMIFTVVLVALFYPITGHWIWGGGWLGSLSIPFQDFAGSTVVHSVGGWAGLAGILMLGPRMGKYARDGRVQPIPGHSMALAFLGGMILWLGWFGFNPGSFMAADVSGISHVVVTTNLACAAGLVSSTITAWILLGKPDFSMTVNGALAGLVAITAPCAFVTPVASVIIGLVGGVLVVFGVIGFDRLQIDDPVGALSVHLVNGIWGTLAVGLFGTSDSPGGGADGLFYGGGFGLLGTQLLGVIAVGAFTMVASFAAWAVIKATVGLRVEPEVERVGLDISEMGMEAYPAEPAHALHAPPVGSAAHSSSPQPAGAGQ